MDTIMLDRAYLALCETMGDVKGWEQIAPVRVCVPLAIQRKEAELVEALEAQDMAVTLNEQARTDVTVEALWEATDRVNVICKELEFLRDMWRQHPDAFEEA